MNGSNASNGGCKTVLVIEPNPDDTLLLQVAARETCPDVGFQFVPDGAQALAYLNGEELFADRREYPFPNVLLVDVRLPNMDGFQFLERIRRLFQWDELTVLAWSDGSNPCIGERARQAGVDYFVPKPFSFAQLMEEVDRICALARATSD